MMAPNEQKQFTVPSSSSSDYYSFAEVIQWCTLLHLRKITIRHSTIDIVSR